MFKLIGSLLSGWQGFAIVAGVVGALGLSGIAYFKGRAHERAAWVTRLQEDRISIFKDGVKVDEKVLSADDDELCVLLGGCGLSE